MPQHSKFFLGTVGAWGCGWMWVGGCVGACVRDYSVPMQCSKEASAASPMGPLEQQEMAEDVSHTKIRYAPLLAKGGKFKEPFLLPQDPAPPPQQLGHRPVYCQQ